MLFLIFPCKSTYLTFGRCCFLCCFFVLRIKNNELQTNNNDFETKHQTFCFKQITPLNDDMVWIFSIFLR